MVELPLFIRLIPKNLREFKGEIESRIAISRGRGIPTTAPEVGAMTEIAQEVGEQKSISLGMLGKLGAILGGIGLIVNALMSLKPLVAMFELVSRIISLFFLPFVMMAYKLLRPVLIYLLRLMVLWYKFWQDPVGNIKNAISGLFEGAKNIGEYLKGLLPPEQILKLLFPSLLAVDIINKLFPQAIDLGGKIWEKLLEFWKTTKDFGNWIWEKLKTIWNWTYDFADWLWNVITESLQTKIEKLYDFGKWLWDELTKKFSEGIDKFSEFADWLWNQITAKIEDGIDVLSELGSKIMSWAMSKIKSFAGGIGDVIDWTKRAIGLDDFIITKGRVYKTNPEDTIIGTKKGVGQSITNNIHLHITGFIDDDLIPILVDKISDELGRRVKW